MADQYVARDRETGFEVTVTGEFPEHPDDRMRIARTTTLFTKLMSTLLQRDESMRRMGFRAIETQLEIADALIRQDHAEVQRLVRETLTSMGVSEDQLREMAQRLSEASGLDPRVAQELSRAFGFESDPTSMDDPNEADVLDATASEMDAESEPLNPQILEQLDQLLADAERSIDEAEPDTNGDTGDESEPDDDQKGPTA
ncbi:MAG: hypothetical protein F4066_04080 [Chloroflexi bacterium]|nr:hypothetical protein [Chloroflexota bacterium]MYF80800.1 hypothetical protein [Chloroflexota bacterium]MYI04021.1 hypothetical protein [Chloroflexota bacterium]